MGIRSPIFWRRAWCSSAAWACRSPQGEGGEAVSLPTPEASPQAIIRARTFRWLRKLGGARSSRYRGLKPACAVRLESASRGASAALKGVHQLNSCLRKNVPIRLIASRPSGSGDGNGTGHRVTTGIADGKQTHLQLLAQASEDPKIQAPDARQTVKA